MKLTSWLCCIAITLSCNTSPDKQIANDTQSRINHASAAIEPSSAPTTSAPNDSTINITFNNNTGTVTVHSQMKGVGAPVTVNIAVKGGQRLNASLQPGDSTANIRINQFFTPGNKADGPFGRHISEPLTQKGTYRLIIGESLMAASAYKGKFSLTVTVE